MTTLAFGDGLVEWAGKRLGVDDFGPAQAMGAVKDNRLIAVVVYSNYNGHNLEISLASVSPLWCSRGFLAALFHYPFEQLHCRRVTVTVATHNSRTRNLVERLGFELEGFHKKLMHDGSDALSYGLLKENCRWLPKRMEYYE